ncbi:class I SAM-dependent methyltransferase [Terasakiella pusilla]|uniref:class I SAM-dependent methyltransferase n=1 Tax=Terasakiella pusilla TaxID=64973 RepID=UPI00146FB935|nr:class I SAM-dependent methyltransferase [Terasakiella pusilla]
MQTNEMAYIRRIADADMQENAYGHLNRISFFRQFLKPSDKILEFGCGTGLGVCFPLITLGYDVTGLDRDEKSIAYGQDVLAAKGYDKSILKCQLLEELPDQFDVIIASEVLEHCNDKDIATILPLLTDKLKEGGVLLVTVPNGRGWYEAEAALWKKLNLGHWNEKLNIRWFFENVKNKLIGNWVDSVHPTSFDSSPHVQCFSYNELPKRLAKYGFRCISKRGAVLASGPVSHLLFTGYWWAMKLNLMLGKALSPIASGYWYAFQKK